AYVVIWALSYFIHSAIKYSELIDVSSFVIGFLVGLFLLIAHWILTTQVYQLLVVGEGKAPGSYVLLKSDTNYKIVTENNLFLIPKNKIAMMAKEAYLAHKRNGNIKDIDVKEYYEKASANQYRKGELWKQMGESTFVDRSSNSQMDDVAYRFTMIMLSLAVITAKMDISLFYALLPWFIMATIFSIGTQSVFILNPRITGVVGEYLTKQKLLIVGLSFGVMAISVILRR
ncbi:MAG: hypothetical protein QF704_14325, partial [Anaerolineales bacterium]|nr:hypothetical protein [Anaerolineales bacterium]